jgi:putative ABC transport system permease protein
MKYAKLIFKNILRNKRRTLLTISSLVVSLFLIISLATILTEFERGSSEASPLRLVSRHAVSLGFVLPTAHLQKIKTVPGVKDAMPFSWFGASTKTSETFLPTSRSIRPSCATLVPRGQDAGCRLAAFINDPAGARSSARRLVTLYGFISRTARHVKRPIYNQSVEFIIRGVYTGSDEKTLYFHYDYLNELLPAWAKDKVSTFSIMANSAQDVPRVGQAIDSNLRQQRRADQNGSDREFAMSFRDDDGRRQTVSLRHHGGDHVLAVARDGQHDGDDGARTHEGSRHTKSDRFSARHDNAAVSR